MCLEKKSTACENLTSNPNPWPKKLFQLGWMPKLPLFSRHDVWWTHNHSHVVLVALDPFQNQDILQISSLFEATGGRIEARIWPTKCNMEKNMLSASRCTFLGHRAGFLGHCFCMVYLFIAEAWFCVAFFFEAAFEDTAPLLLEQYCRFHIPGTDDGWGVLDDVIQWCWLDVS